MGLFSRKVRHRYGKKINRRSGCNPGGKWFALSGELGGEPLNLPQALLEKNGHCCR